MASKRRILVVANRTADSDELLSALRERAREGPLAVTLLVPATWEVIDPHGGRESAARRRHEATARLRREGIEVECVTGDPDPEAAVRSIWQPDRFDEVVVSTLPSRLSAWLRRDLPRRVEALVDTPVTHVVATEREGSPA